MEKLTIEEMERLILKAIHGFKESGLDVLFSATNSVSDLPRFAIYFNSKSNQKANGVFISEEDNLRSRKQKLDIVINAIHGDEKALDTIWKGKI